MKSLLLLLTLATPLARAELNVVATLPDFAAIAESIGGRNIKVTTIARGTEDAHFVDARPSFIRVLNRADVLIEGGADMEVGWLPTLLNTARNPKIQGAAPGHLVLAPQIELIDVPKGAIDRSMGDVHPTGNPHFWLEPRNGSRIAELIAERLTRLDPANAGNYQKNLQQFNATLEAKTAQWDKRLAPYKGTKIVTYHKSFDYFARHFGFEVVAQLEPKPGVEPSAVHINSLLHNQEARAAKVVIIESFRPRRTAEQVAEKLGAKLLILPDKVGGVPEAKDYFSLFDYLVDKLADALAPPK